MHQQVVAALQCYVKKGEKYLMLHRSLNKKVMPDVWMAPGGHLDEGEGVFKAARREIQEETGLMISNIQLKAIGIGRIRDIKQTMCIYLLTADYQSGEVVHVTEHDGEFIWLEKSEILKLPNLLAELHNVLDHVFSDSKNTISYYAEYEKGNEMSKFELE